MLQIFNYGSNSILYWQVLDTTFLFFAFLRYYSLILYDFYYCYMFSSLFSSLTSFSIFFFQIWNENTFCALISKLLRIFQQNYILSLIIFSSVESLIYSLYIYFWSMIRLGRSLWLFWNDLMNLCNYHLISW